MKNLKIAFQIWWHHFVYVHLSDWRRPHKADGLGSQMVTIRTTQSLLGGPIEKITIGNSRLHEFEAQLDEIKDMRALPISGSTAHGWLGYWKEIVAPSRPKVIVEDLGGNDFLQGKDVETVFADQIKLYNALKATGAQVLVFEICYLGPKAFPGVNAKLAQYNEKLAAAIGDDFIKLNDILCSNGVMKNEYNIGDDVHHTILAYIDAYAPRLRAKLIAKGFGV